MRNAPYPDTDMANIQSMKCWTIFKHVIFQTGNHERQPAGQIVIDKNTHNTKPRKLYQNWHKEVLWSSSLHILPSFAHVSEMSNGMVTIALLCHRYYKKVTPLRYSLLQKKSNAVPLPLPEKVTPLVTPVTSNAVMPSHGVINTTGVRTRFSAGLQL